jgi:RiboL-PSP-HEPN
MTQETGVDRIYREFSNLIEHLDQNGEISLGIAADENFRKSLLMAAASYFEDRLSKDLYSFFESISRGNELAISFVRAKAIKRQFHTYFNWDGSNANQFFSLFGDGFKEFMKEQIKADKELDLAIRAFLEIGSNRNRLAHSDFATFPLEKNSKEIYDSYKLAMKFLDSFPDKLNSYMRKTNEH